MGSARRTRIGAVASHIKASVDHVWATLTDAKSWQAWWPDGAPETGDEQWATGRELVWAHPPNPESSRARITELEAPAADALAHIVGGAKLKFTFEPAGVDFEFRVDGVAKGLTNVILGRTGPHIKERGLKGPREKYRLEKQLKDMADALKAAVEAHAASLGPRFHFETREPFLRWSFNAFLKQNEVLTIHYDQARHEPTSPAPPPPAGKGALGALRAFFTVESGAPDQSTGSVPVEVTVKFPPVCSACLEPTTRTEESYGNISSSTRVDSTQTLVRRISVPFNVPLCERCASYGLDGLISIAGHTITVPVHKRDIGDWVHFRFPNVGYYQPFLEANDLPADRVAPGKYDAQRATQRGRDVAKLEEELESWRSVRDGLGFHRYAQLKHRLLQLGSGDPGDLADRLSSLAGEFSVTVEQLRQVERIADEPIAALRVLDHSA